MSQSCVRCQHENLEGNLFCAQCGNSLRAVATDPSSGQKLTSIAGDPNAFEWSAPQAVPSHRLQHPETMVPEVADAAKCPQCASPQTQSFEMAYSMSTSSGVTSGAAYTFGVGPTITGARSTQQSNLASYVRPPVRAHL
jgi:hypothetical protein